MPRPLAALSIGAIALIAGCGSSTISTEPVRVETRDASPNDRIRAVKSHAEVVDPRNFVG